MAHRVGVWIGLAALAIAVAPPGWADDSLERVTSSKSARIGFANEAPFTYQQADGSLGGADYETAKALLEKLGVTKLEGVLVNFASLIPGLNAKRFDIVAAGLYIRKERCAQALFSDPNLVVSDAVIVRSGNPKKITSFKSIAADASIRLGGTTGGAQVTNAVNGGVPKAQIMEFPDVTSAFAAIRAARIDGALQTTVTARWNVKTANDPNIEVAAPFQALKSNGDRVANYAAFVFALGDQKLRDAFNAELVKFLGTPAHFEILSKYGMTNDEVPTGVTAPQACAM
jgi:polar amino acid transport system substrate-binding protein